VISNRNFVSFSHVGELRAVNEPVLEVYADSSGRDSLGFLRYGDLVSVVGYDWREDELQVLTRLGLGWVGPYTIRFTNRLLAC
jgi:hypothetical protein